LQEKNAIVNTCESIKKSIDVINEANEQNVSEISEINKSAGMLSDNACKLKDGLLSMNEAAADMKSSTRQLDDIARKTKLIALNALIEAAHAGKFGVTFGVVAGEVRELAQHSSKAVDSTKSSELSLSENILSTNEIFDSIDTMVEEIKINIGQISDHIEAVDDKCKNVCKTLDSLL
jgi:methyl-accepting chemotaxis protein